MAYDTGYLFRQGANGQTKTVTSQRNRIYSPHAGQTGMRVIGVMGEFGVNETRKVDPVRGIGFGDQIAELVPGNTEPAKISVTRTALYLQNLMQTFGYNAGASGLVRSLKHHKWPFDIRQEIVFSEIASEIATSGSAEPWAPENIESGHNNLGAPADMKAIFTIFEGCWFDSYDYTFSSNDVIVTEKCNIQSSDIFDGTDSVYGMFIDSGNSGAAGGSQRSVRFTGRQGIKTGGSFPYA